MNYFYNLPEVLQENILYIRDNNMAKKIQKKYQSRYIKINALASLYNQLDCYDDYDEGMAMIEISTEKSARVIEFIEKRIKKNDKIVCDKLRAWNKMLFEINHALIMEEFVCGWATRGSRSHGDAYYYYNRVEKSFNNITNIVDTKWRTLNM